MPDFVFCVRLSICPKSIALIGVIQF